MDQAALAQRMHVVSPIMSQPQSESLSIRWRESVAGTIRVWRRSKDRVLQEEIAPGDDAPIGG